MQLRPADLLRLPPGRCGMTARTLTAERLRQMDTSHARVAAIIAERAGTILAAKHRPDRHGTLEVFEVAGALVYLEAHPTQLRDRPNATERPWPWGGAR